VITNGITTTTFFATGTLPTPGNWSVFTATFTGLAAEVGDSITIQLASNGAQGDWDDVVLSSAVVTPEPASGVLMALAFAVVGIVRRKRA
jgi:hypothetical protein